MRIRFIPARAGNTSGTSSPWRNLSVHPRSRGEHRAVRAAAKVSDGSSPLARGTQRQRISGRLATRFIPARAGNTDPISGTRGTKPVHPRSRGEHELPLELVRRSTGSSPLARGTRLYHNCRRSRLRFIPARAGNTSHSLIKKSDSSVHPRSRGEH